MMYCVNCDYPITRQELDLRKCDHCGCDPAQEKCRRAYPYTVWGESVTPEVTPDKPKQQEPPRDS